MQLNVPTSALLILFLANAKTASSDKFKYECPQLPKPNPCVCISAFANVFLTCSAMENVGQLQDTMKAMAGHGITELKIRDSSFRYVPHNLFYKTEVSKIRIENSTIFYLFNREPEDRSLKQIVLDNIYFEGGLDWNTLEELTQLQVLSVSSSGLENIAYDVSQLELPLETLILPYNDIQTIHELAFQKFVNLKILKLNNNFLTVFKRSMLPQPTSGLQYLDLSRNRLAYLPEDSFTGMPQLHSLILRGNNFVVLEKTAVKNVLSSLFFFDVSDNPLECDCHLAWLLSADKPFHFFGWCSSEDGNDDRRLTDLSDSDFEKCDKLTSVMESL